MRLIERLGHPGGEAHNRLIAAARDGLRHAVVGIGFGPTLDSLRVNMTAQRVPAFTPAQMSVIVDQSSTVAFRRPAFGEVPKFGVDGKQMFAWRRRSAFLRWLGRADQGVQGANNLNGFGHDGINLELATDGPPFIPAPFPLEAYAAVDGINFDVPLPANTTGLTQDYYGFNGYPDLIFASEVLQEDLISGDWGVEFRDGFSFQTQSGAWVDGWSFDPTNPGGLLWNLVHHVDGFVWENYPFTKASPAMGGANTVSAAGKAYAEINAAVQTFDLFNPDNGSNFLGMIPDNAVIHSARAEIRLTSLTGETADFRYRCVAGVVEEEPGFPIIESVPAQIRFALLGGKRVGSGVRAGTRWEPLAVSVENMVFTSDLFQVVDITPIIQVWVNTFRSSKYHVIGLMPIVGSEPVGFDSSPQQLMRSLFQRHEYAVYAAPSRTTAGARGGSAYYPDPATGNVDKVFESRQEQASISWTGLQGGLCHIEWSMPEDWAGRDVPHSNWPPFVA